jgi:hypothetical protein
MMGPCAHDTGLLLLLLLLLLLQAVSHLSVNTLFLACSNVRHNSSREHTH